MIQTGIKRLDAFLQGGMAPGVLLDVFGANSTGKTQFLLQLCIACIKDGGRVLYVDTTGDFRPERVMELQEGSKPDVNPLQQISVSRVRNTSEQIGALQDMEKYSLVLIDNITDLFSYEYQKRESMLEKNATFMRYMKSLSKMAVSNQVPVVLTNMVRVINGTETENMKAAISPFTHIRIHFTKAAKNYTGTATWALGQETFAYKIAKSGLSDAQDI